MASDETSVAPSNRSSVLGDVALGSLPAVTAFWVIPTAIYLPNQAELHHSTTVLVPYALLSVLWLVGLLVTLRYTRGRRRQRVVHGLFWVGMFLFLSDIVAPVQLNPLDGTQLRPDEPLALTIREGVLAGVIVLAAWKTPAPQARLFGIGFVTLLTVLQPIWLATGVSAGTVRADPHPAPAAPTTKPNIYHLTFDAYHGLRFENALTALAERPLFDGFVLFPNTRSNYVYTSLSVASYMTGTFYTSGSFYQWLRTPYESGIAGELSDQSFVVWNYAHSPGFVHRRASHVTTNTGLMAERSRMPLTASFGDLWLVRVVPNALQDEAFSGGKGIFSRFYERFFEAPSGGVAEMEARAYYSVALARKLIEDEQRRPARGQYVYAHIYLPHPRYVMDARCRYAPGAATFESQTHCATRLMADFLRELKRLGRYDEATIILHSDHTGWEIGAEPPADDPRNAELLRDNVWRAEPAMIASLTRALLVIKPGGRAGVPLEVSGRPAQLVDIPATLYHAGGVVPRTPPPEGLSLFGAEAPADREAPVFLGYRSTDASGRYSYLGRDVMEAELNHFSHSWATGWKRYGNRAVKW